METFKDLSLNKFEDEALLLEKLLSEEIGRAHV